MKRILIIEDEEELLGLLHQRLTQEGYEVEIARNGKDGLKMIRESGPDLILLDIVMPVMDGFEVMEEINKDEKLKKISIIIISNSGQPVEIERAINLGAKDYLVKVDFTPNDVLEKVRKQIGKGERGVKDKWDTIFEGGIKKDIKKPQERAIIGANILVVEDDKFLRDIIVQKLMREDFNVFATVDAEEAFQLMKEKKPQIILLDLVLPGMGGFAMLAQLKTDPSLADIPVIILSNLGEKEDVERAMAAGAVDYLIKANFTTTEIVEKIRNILNQKIL